MLLKSLLISNTHKVQLELAEMSEVFLRHLKMVLDGESLRIKVLTNHTLRMNVSNKFHGNPSNSC